MQINNWNGAKKRNSQNAWIARLQANQITYTFWVERRISFYLLFLVTNLLVSFVPVCGSFGFSNGFVIRQAFSLSIMRCSIGVNNNKLFVCRGFVRSLSWKRASAHSEIQMSIKLKSTALEKERERARDSTHLISTPFNLVKGCVDCLLIVNDCGRIRNSNNNKKH